MVFFKKFYCSMFVLLLSASMFSCNDDNNDSENETVDILYTNRVQSTLTAAQINFVNSHYYAIMTSYANTLVKENIVGSKILLYRSIQDAWDDAAHADHFDWDHINSNENMFCHDSDSTYDNDRIYTRWDGWLMSPDDLVDPDDSEALSHWINYYAVKASETVCQYDYDGLFIDSAAHKITTWLGYGLLPDNYSDEAWRDARYEALEFIKSYLPDKFVMFNGLHSENGSEHSLTLVDGGMWEVFAFNSDTGAYYGFDEWVKVIELVRDYRSVGAINIVSKKSGLSSDIQSRIFVVSSYLLVCTPNVYLSMVDMDYDILTALYYYPELDIDPGTPSGGYYTRGNVYARDFDKILVLVNPSADQTYEYTLNSTFRRLVPVGGGVIQDDGQCDTACSLTYEDVSGTIELPPVSGAILFRQ